MKTILILAVTLALTACGPDKPKNDPKADKEAIDKVRDDFMSAFNAGDAAKVGALYSENASQLPGNQPTVQGRAAIVERNKSLFDQASAKIHITPHTTTVSGDMAFDEGTYALDLTPKAKGSQPMSEMGRYIVILQRDADGWKVVEDIDNTTTPPAPQAPPSAKAKAPAKTTAKAPTKVKK